MYRILMTALLGSAAMPAAAQPWGTNVELGFFSSQRGSSDSSDAAEDGPYGGAYIAGQFGRTLGSGLELGVDMRFEALNEDTDDVDDYGRIQTGVLGVHVGRNVAPDTYAGGFAGLGYFAAESGDDTNTGFIVGGEIARTFGAVNAFAQLGYAVAEPDPDDNAFIGPVYRLGASFELMPALDMTFALEGGTSPTIFEDDEDSGRFTIFSITGVYEINASWDAVASVAIENYTANTEDSGEEANLYLGVRYNIGGEASSLTTPMGAFKAVDWASELD